MSDKKQVKGMTAAETKELRRVFDYCANFLPKQEIYAKLNPFLDRKNDLVAFVNNPDAVEVKDDEGNIMEADSINEELEALNVKIDELQKRIASYDNNPTKKIHPEDLNEAMKVLGRKCTKKEIQDMIWEVDENLDDIEKVIEVLKLWIQEGSKVFRTHNYFLNIDEYNLSEESRNLDNQQKVEILKTLTNLVINVSQGKTTNEERDNILDNIYN